MELNLTKPIIFFDLETTGIVIGKAKIIEIAMIKVMPDNSEVEFSTLINPGEPIPSNITELTGIADEDVIGKPTFAQIANQLLDFIGDSDLAGYNSNKFDIPLLVEEFLRIGVDFSMTGRNLVDVQNIFHKMEARTLVAAYQFYCNKELEGAHSAANDTRATYEVFKSQLDRYKDTTYKDKQGNTTKPIVNDMKQLADFTKTNNWVDLAGHIYLNDKCEECFNFGKYKDKPVEWVFRKERSYYDWMMKAEFPLDTKRVITRIYQMMFI